MKTAIAYYSMSGNTEETAQKIAKKLGAALIRIDPEKEYPNKGLRKFIWGGKSAVMGETPALQSYSFSGDFENVIIGTPVWASNIAPPIRTFIKENRDKLNGKSISAFVCCSGGGAEKALGKLKEALGVNRLDAEMVLIDPKDKPSAENDTKISMFCGNLIEL